MKKATSKLPSACEPHSWRAPTEPLTAVRLDHTRPGAHDRQGGSLVNPSTTATVHAESAIEKVRRARGCLNSRDPEKVSLAYTVDSRWRNRSEFIQGRDEIVAFLTRKWARELEYRLIKELWAFEGNRIAVRFAYEWHDDSGNWFRSYGNENWEFDENGLMRLRLASINDLQSNHRSASTIGRWDGGPMIIRL